MFTDRLKESTSLIHGEAESSTFMKQLFNGSLSKDSYIKYLTVLEQIYLALESQIRSASANDLVKPFIDSRLDRHHLIASDLNNLGGKQKLSRDIEMFLNNYIDIIHGSHGAALLAHHYIRYLGDMSGGQAIKKIVSNMYGLKSNQTTFYDFDFPIKPYRDLYKQRLNDTIVSLDDQTTFIASVSQIYRMTIQILDSL